MHYDNNKPKYIRYAIYVVSIAIVVLLQNSRGALPEIMGGRAMLALPFVVSLAMHEREVAAAVFGICFLVDKGFTKLFRNQSQHHTGKAVRLSKRYGSIGLILAVFGIGVLFAGLPDNWLFIASSILIFARRESSFFALCFFSRCSITIQSLGSSISKYVSSAISCTPTLPLKRHSSRKKFSRLLM